MFKKIILISLFLNISTNTIMAEEIPTLITPVKYFSTCGKYVFEGDEISFKVLSDNKMLNESEILTGTILTYKPNGFYGEEAMITFGNFVTEKGSHVKGKLYLGGNQHKKFAEFCDNYTESAPFFVRGGEIKLYPDKTELNVFLEK